MLALPAATPPDVGLMRPRPATSLVWAFPTTLPLCSTADWLPQVMEMSAGVWATRCRVLSNSCLVQESSLEKMRRLTELMSTVQGTNVQGVFGAAMGASWPVLRCEMGVGCADHAKWGWRRQSCGNCRGNTCQTAQIGPSNKGLFGSHLFPWRIPTIPNKIPFHQ